jgi:hypothetical protein
MITVDGAISNFLQSNESDHHFVFESKKIPNLGIIWYKDYYDEEFGGPWMTFDIAFNNDFWSNSGSLGEGSFCTSILPNDVDNNYDVFCEMAKNFLEEIETCFVNCGCLDGKVDWNTFYDRSVLCTDGWRVKGLNEGIEKVAWRMTRAKIRDGAYEELTESKRREGMLTFVPDNNKEKYMDALIEKDRWTLVDIEPKTDVTLMIMWDKKSLEITMLADRIYKSLEHGRGGKVIECIVYSGTNIITITGTGLANLYKNSSVTLSSDDNWDEEKTG